MTQDTCLEYGAALDEGFIPDMTHAAVMQLVWQRGVPEDARFLGLKNGVKLQPVECLTVTAQHCTKCGLLKILRQADQLRDLFANSVPVPSRSWKRDFTPTRHTF